MATRIDRDANDAGCRALIVDAQQLWLAPFIVGTAWWNAALEAWLAPCCTLSRAAREPPYHLRAGDGSVARDTLIFA